MVRLVPMTEDEFQAYLKGAVEGYAEEHVTAGNWAASDALQKSEQEFMQLLPEGVASKKQHLFSIEEGDTGVKIGMIWFAEREEANRPSAFIYDFMVYAEYRNKGYGRQALTALDEKVEELGIKTISLHVFGHNPAAIHLYQSAGYEVTNLLMTKKLIA